MGQPDLSISEYSKGLESWSKAFHMSNAVMENLRSSILARSRDMASPYQASWAPRPATPPKTVSGAQDASHGCMSLRRRRAQALYRAGSNMRPL
eukprot:1709350-Alexandrium_andersonii.AAC.1